MTVFANSLVEMCVSPAISFAVYATAGLDEKAIEAVREWRFEPGRKEIAVAVQINLEVNFHLY